MLRISLSPKDDRGYEPYFRKSNKYIFGKEVPGTKGFARHYTDLYRFKQYAQHFILKTKTQHTEVVISATSCDMQSTPSMSWLRTSDMFQANCHLMNAGVVADLTFVRFVHTIKINQTNLELISSF